MKSPLFTIEDDKILLQTPWGDAPIPGKLLVNGAAATTDWEILPTLDDRGLLHLELRNASTQTQFLNTISVCWNPECFSPALVAGDFRELIHGGSFLNMSCGVKVVGRRQQRLDFNPTGNMVYVLQNDDGQALLLGILPPLGNGFSEFRTLHSERHLDGDIGFSMGQEFRCAVAAGETTACSPFFASSGSDGTALLENYGKLWSECPQSTTKPGRIGWNSWDHWAGAITRKDINRNLAASRELFGDALDVFCIDEGYESQWGSWDANAKFPEGLADYCQHVKASGSTPGIWTAPLLVNTYNPLYFAHPEWFATRADGEVLSESYSYGPMAYLDPTQDAVLEWIGENFRRLRGYGFEYFKVDFSHCILKADRFQDPSVGRAALIRRAFATIRDAIGPDAYLLSCGTPFESIYGIADAVRTTGDIHVFWGHILANAANIAARFWMHRNLFNVDPDFLVVRGPETAAPPYGRKQNTSPMPPEGGWISGRVFNESEARVWALTVHLSGGDIILGDELPALFANGRDMLSRVLEPRPAAVPVDLFTSEQDLPQIWISKSEDNVLVGLFNWTDKPASIDFDPKEYGLQGTPKDFWTGESAEIPGKMARRSSTALLFPR